MVNKLADQLPENVTKEQAKDLIEGLVMTNSIFNGGSQVNSVPDSATAEFNVRTIQNIIMTKLKNYLINI